MAFCLQVYLQMFPVPKDEAPEMKSLCGFLAELCLIDFNFAMQPVPAVAAAVYVYARFVRGIKPILQEEFIDFFFKGEDSLTGGDTKGS